MTGRFGLICRLGRHCLLERAPCPELRDQVGLADRPGLIVERDVRGSYWACSVRWGRNPRIATCIFGSAFGRNSLPEIQRRASETAEIEGLVSYQMALLQSCYNSAELLSLRLTLFASRKRMEQLTCVFGRFQFVRASHFLAILRPRIPDAARGIRIAEYDLGLRDAA